MLQIGEIVGRFEKKGYKLGAAKFLQAGRPLLEEHYADLKDKKFFPGLISYMLSGPVFATVWEGRDAALGGRRLLGATRPQDSAPGTIRADFALDVGRNLIHGSDSVDSAKAEIKLWFPEGVTKYTRAVDTWVYE